MTDCQTDGCPFNQPDATQAAREELDMQATNEPTTEEMSA